MYRGCEFTRSHQRIENSAASVRDIGMHHEVPNARDVRLVAVLLEEEPLKNLRALETISRHEGRAFGKVRDDRVRLEQQFAVVEFNRGNSSVGKFAEKFGRACLALGDIEFDPLERDLKLRQQQTNFVTVAGDQ